MGTFEAPKYWRVIGAADVGGIMVRDGRSTKSTGLGRLAVGSIVAQADQAGDRIRFKMMEGDGPKAGWVSLHSGRGTELLEACDFGAEFEEEQEERQQVKVTDSEDPGQLNDLAAPTNSAATDPAAPGGAYQRTKQATKRDSNIILPGPAALKAWFDELSKRAEAYRPAMPAGNLSNQKAPSMFLVFTSMSGVLGLSRQFEYAAANSFLDAICHFRHKQGLSAREMHIGNVHGVGLGMLAPESAGVSPGVFGQLFSHIMSHAEHPGADIFELPKDFVGMGRKLNLTYPYMRNFDAKYDKRKAANATQQPGDENEE